MDEKTQANIKRSGENKLKGPKEQILKTGIMTLNAAVKRPR
jgi:hypothetical protein